MRRIRRRDRDGNEGWLLQKLLELRRNFVLGRLAESIGPRRGRAPGVETVRRAVHDSDATIVATITRVVREGSARSFELVG